MSIFQILFGKKAAQKDSFWSALPPKFDITQGYEVLYGPSLFLGWETTFKDLENLNICTIKEVYQNSFEYRFIYPVRLGTMILTEFKANFWHDDHLYNPVKNYMCNLVTQDNQAFFGAKKLLSQAFSYYLVSDYKISDNSSYEISMKGITFTLDEFTHSLRIFNDRDFAGLRDIDEYEKVIELSSILIFGKSKEIYANYKKSRFIKRTPTIISQNYPLQSIAWHDEKNEIMGITGWENSVIFPQKLLEKIVVEVMQPAKDGGFYAINLKIQGEITSLTLWMGNFSPIGEGDKQAEKLAKFFDVPIEYVDLGYDC